MSIQWVAVAGFLYLEIAITLLLILPLLKSSAWKWIFSMRIFAAIQPIWTTIYYAILLILVVLFIDSIRRIRKYGDIAPGATLDAKLDWRLNECRGQRNFYITGFALFLILVIKRLITIQSSLATLEASHAAIVRQAQAANTELTRRLNQESEEPKDTEKKPPKDGKGKEDAPGPSKEEYAELQNELKKAKTDLEAMRKQAESTSAEYDRLAEEHQILLKQVDGGDESKKDQ